MGRLGGLGVMAGGAVVGLGWYLLEEMPGPGLGILAGGWVLTGIGVLLTLRSRKRLDESTCRQHDGAGMST